MLTINNVFLPFIKMEDGFFFRENNGFVEVECSMQVLECLNALIGEKFTWYTLEDMLGLSKKDFLEVKDFLKEHDIIVEDFWDNRYATNIAYFNTKYRNGNDVQKKISSTKICILGLGGSSFIVQQLAMIGVGKITGVDFDTLQLKNLNRQSLFDERDCGKLKSEVMYRKLSNLNSTIDLKTVNKKIKSVNDVEEILNEDEYDLVILAIDEPIIDSAIWVHEACLKNNIRVISGGIWMDQLTVNFFDYKTSATPCGLCQYNQEIHDEYSKLYFESIKGKRYSNYNTTSTYNASLLSGIMIKEIIKIIVGDSSALLHATGYHVNSDNFHVDKYKILESAHCNCGKKLR